MSAPQENHVQKTTATGLEGVDRNQEMNQFMNNLVSALSVKFEQMSQQIIGKLDQMGDRIDSLEKQMDDIMDQAGIDKQQVHNQTDRTLDNH
mmetsp:Transcript_18672/g.20763  ORF Transcript_18672/g.20763 Transcript_18672/m.20763 type:complete len:92 (-) Transcript_18672:608-883(-)